jgi:hypothetical protein
MVELMATTMAGCWAWNAAAERAAHSDQHWADLMVVPRAY